MPGFDDKKCFIQGYNGQPAVDSKNQIIVAKSLCNQATDQKQLKEVVPKIKANLNRKPDELWADAGYFSENNLDYLREEEKIAPYITTGPSKAWNVAPKPTGSNPEGSKYRGKNAPFFGYQAWHEQMPRGVGSDLFVS